MRANLVNVSKQFAEGRTYTDSEMCRSLKTVTTNEELLGKMTMIIIVITVITLSER